MVLLSLERDRKSFVDQRRWKKNQFSIRERQMMSTTRRPAQRVPEWDEEKTKSLAIWNAIVRDTIPLNH